MKPQFKLISSGILIVFLCLSACTQNVSSTTAALRADKLTDPMPLHQTGWRSVRFNIAWEPDNEPNWYIDTMIAGEILAPFILSEQGRQLRFWRVHRRAVNDATGQAFSFIFYAETSLSERIYSSIRKHPLLNQWQQEGKIIRVEFDDLRQNPQPHLEDASDKSWPIELQKTWPEYITGASRMWLGLIQAYKALAQTDTPIEERYLTIQQQITKLWENNGQHAWLHHLNALYAYSPTYIHY